MRTNHVPRQIARWDAAALKVEPAYPDLPAAIDRCELVWVQPLDHDDEPSGPLIRVGQGSASRVHVPLPSVLSAALAAHVERFALIHSHTSGSLLVSEEDKALTRAVLKGATACGLILVDHYIVSAGATRVLSFVESGILERAPNVAEIVVAARD